jgi:hypothetical protein
MAKLDQTSLNAARMILDNPLVIEILEDMETAAINGAVQANITDEIKPAAYLAEVRAIRAFRSRLQFIIDETPANLKRNEAAE